MQQTLMIEQIQTFALTIGLGVFIGLGYDFLRAVKTFVRFSRPAQFFVDLGFWILMTAVVFVALLTSNWGEVRAYIFIGLGIGGLLYVLLVSKTFYRLTVRMLTAIFRFIGYLLRPVLWTANKAMLIGRAAAKGGTAAGRVCKKFPTKFRRKKKE